LRIERPGGPNQVGAVQIAGSFAGDDHGATRTAVILLEVIFRQLMLFRSNGEYC
jgi:hypothetical protein